MCSRCAVLSPISGSSLLSLHAEFSDIVLTSSQLGVLGGLVAEYAKARKWTPARRKVKATHLQNKQAASITGPDKFCRTLGARMHDVMFFRWIPNALQESKFSEAERLTEEARRAAREAHLRAEEALQKQRQAEEAERAAQQLRAKHDQQAHQLEALRAKVRASPAGRVAYLAL